MPTTGYAHTFSDVTLSGYSIVGFFVETFSKIADVATVDIIHSNTNVYVKIKSNLDYDVSGLNYRIKVLWMKT